MGSLFFTIFYQPLFNLLIALTMFAGGSIGWGIILVTVAVRALLYPLTEQSLTAQRSMQKLQPMIAELKAKHKDNKEKFSKELMELYKQQKVNPFSSCVTVLSQLPVLFALYRAFQIGLDGKGVPDGVLYSFVSAPQTIQIIFFGINLGQPNLVLSVIAGLLQYLQARSLPKPPTVAQPVDGAKDEQMASMMNKQMMYIFPIMTVVIGMSIPSGLTLYWAISTLLLYLQQLRSMRASTV